MGFGVIWKIGSNKDIDTPVVDGSQIVLPLRTKVKGADAQATGQRGLGRTVVALVVVVVVVVLALVVVVVVFLLSCLG